MLNFLGCLLTGESTTGVDWSSIITADSFSGLLDGVSDVLPVVIPVAIVIAGIPICWKFVKKFMRG